MLGERDDRYVSREPVYRGDLFKGTADYYDRFRPPYPPVLLDGLRVRVPIGGTARLLDLACGTGQIAFALAGDFAEVWAVDQEAEFVAFGNAKAQRLGVANIHWLAASAEDVSLDGPFDLIGIGNAFHRLRRQHVAQRAMSLLAPGGCLALLWRGTPWRGDRCWQQTMNDTLQHWMRTADATDRVPADWEQAMDRDRHDAVLRRAGFSYEGRFEFATEHDWTVETLTGFVSSTSFLNRGALGVHVEAFERDLREQLLACDPGGVFRETTSFAYELARSPT